LSRWKPILDTLGQNNWHFIWRSTRVFVHGSILRHWIGCTRTIKDSGQTFRKLYTHFVFQIINHIWSSQNIFFWGGHVVGEEQSIHMYRGATWRRETTWKT
jgi:hypothetical protein